jgi:predicted MFS family arabinose efflux permease
VLIAALIGPMQVAGRLAMVATGQRFDHRQFMLTSFAMIAIAVTFLRFGGDTRALIVAFVLLYGSAWGTVSILRPVITRDILGEANFGAKSGSIALIFLAGVAMSAYFGSLIWAWVGYGALLVILIAMAIAGALFYTAAHRLAARG